MVARACVLAALVGVMASSVQTAAAQGASLPDDLAIIGLPALVPFGNGSSVYIGSSDSVGTSVGRLTLGPCGYDVAHWHAQAWETITPITPGAPITTIVQGPVPGSPQESFVTNPQRGSTAVPAGYAHIDFNDNCITAEAILVWNAVNAGGTFPMPQSLFQLSPGFNDAEFPGGLPAPRDPGFWPVDAECAARCGLNVTDAKVAAALKVVDSAADAAREKIILKASAAESAANKVKRLEQNVMAKLG